MELDGNKHQIKQKKGIWSTKGSDDGLEVEGWLKDLLFYIYSGKFIW
jgi:hypothetical protein